MVSNRRNNLKKLNLNKNRLGDKGIEILANAFKNGNFRVNFLNVSNCGFSQVGAR